MLFPTFLTFFSIIFLISVNSKNHSLIKNFSLVSFLIIFLFFTYIFFFLSSKMDLSFFIVNSFDWLYFININLILGIDNISIFFLLLTSFLFPICVLISWNNIKYNLKYYLIILFLLEIFLLNSFMSLNILLFFLFFECTMIPMFLIIGIWGSRQRKIHAVYQFFFYTIFGSIFLLGGILFLFSTCKTLDLRVLNNIFLSRERQIFLFFLFFLGFCIKIPMVPFHIWLPEAHVEAPTSGSVILAGILLKIGSFGMLRFILPFFPYGSLFFSPVVYFLILISIIYISIIAVRQIDLKKIIAYSSIAHMNFIVLGLFSFNLQGIGGSIFLMLSHGFVSSALFICIGILYDRYGSRLLFYYSSLAKVMPIYSSFFFLFILANISFPGSSNFIGELMVLIGIFPLNFLVTTLACFSIILSAIYSIWLVNRVLFGQFNFLLEGFSDLSKREFFILIICLFFILLLGVNPNFVLSKIELSTYLILSYQII